ncbi:hypothetical protein [Methylomagnum ishizawai]|uniref:hypothetical protein n=1 Tax=Methylomagnum ishizawai TaxID=1760988 RepID=UPI001C322E64|nr:hypothetical protein [Methylomagnum ishizawai]BBL73220.1 hypothetical protein MishRS11D_03180 [Methylomagnum ishizawai]
MFEAYRIQSSLILKDETLPTLQRMAAEFDKLDKKVKAVQKNMDMIAKLTDPLHRTAGAVQMISRHLSTAETRSARLLANLTGISRLKFKPGDYGFGGLNFGEGAASVGGGGRRGRSGGGAPMPAMEEPFYAPTLYQGGGPVVPFARPPQQPPPAMPSWPVGMMAGGAAGGGRGFPPGGMPPRLGAPDWIPGNGRGGNPWDRWDRSEPFDTGFREPGGGVPPGMPPQPPRGPFFGHGRNAHQDMMGGLVLMGGGAAGMGALDAALDAAKEYNLELAKFRTLGLGEATNRRADEFARNARPWGTSKAELMSSLRESIGLFNDFDLAKALSPKIAELNAANSLLFGGKIGKIDDKATLALMRFIDRRGGNADRESFLRNLDLAQKMVTGSGGFLQFSDLANFSQMGGTAFRGLSDEGLLKMASLIAEQGGARAGTSLMSMYQNLVAGRTPKKTMALLESLGLGSADEVKSGTVGGKKSTTTTFKLKPEYSQVLQRDPVEFYKSIVLPLLAKKGIASEEKILETINDMLSNRTGSGQAGIMTTQLLQVLRDYDVTKRAMGARDTVRTARDAAYGSDVDLSRSWKDFTLAAGIPALGDYQKAVEGVSGALNTGTKFLDSHQTATKVMTEALGVLFGAAMIGGAWKLTKAAAGFVGLAPDLAAMATTAPAAAAGLGAVAAWIGRLPAMAATLGVGFVAGKSITDNSPWLQGKINKATDYWMDKFGGSPEVTGAISRQEHEERRRLNTTPPPKGGTANPPGDVYLDGRKVGKVIAPHLGKEAAKPQSAASRPDGRRNLQPVAGNVGR